MIAFTDGSYVNKTKAGFAFVVFNNDGNFIFARGENCFAQSPEDAEALAVSACLKYVDQNVTIYVDCLSVISAAVFKGSKPNIRSVKDIINNKFNNKLDIKIIDHNTKELYMGHRLAHSLARYCADLRYKKSKTFRKYEKLINLLNY